MKGATCDLFRHACARSGYAEREPGVSRSTATRYLDVLAGAGLLGTQRIGRSNYVNQRLATLCVGGTA